MISSYNLPNKLEGEKIIKITRRDSFILFKKLMLFLVLLALPLIFFYVMTTVYPALLDGTISYPLIVLAGSFYFLYIWLFFFFNFLGYYLDIWIITNERIIDIRQEGFFSRKVSEQTLDKVQDVTSTINGFFPSILKYGHIEVQTAGTDENFKFDEIPNPEEISNLILKLASDKTKAKTA